MILAKFSMSFRASSVIEMAPLSIKARDLSRSSTAFVTMRPASRPTWVLI